MNLKERYKTEIAPALKEKFGYKSIMQAPKLEKIVINMGISDIKENSKALEFSFISEIPIFITIFSNFGACIIDL